MVILEMRTMINIIISILRLAGKHGSGLVKLVGGPNI